MSNVPTRPLAPGFRDRRLATVDAKGRVALPPDGLSIGVHEWIALPEGASLRLMPLATFTAAIDQSVDSPGNTNPGVDHAGGSGRDVLDATVAKAVRIECDFAGRLALPDGLRSRLTRLTCVVEMIGEGSSIRTVPDAAHVAAERLRFWIHPAACGGGEHALPAPWPADWGDEDRDRFLDGCWALLFGAPIGFSAVEHDRLLWPAASALFHLDATLHVDDVPAAFTDVRAGIVTEAVRRGDGSATPIAPAPTRRSEDARRFLHDALRLVAQPPATPPAPGGMTPRDVWVCFGPPPDGAVRRA